MYKKLNGCGFLEFWNHPDIRFTRNFTIFEPLSIAGNLQKNFKAELFGLCKGLGDRTSAPIFPASTAQNTSRNLLSGLSIE